MKTYPRFFDLLRVFEGLAHMDNLVQLNDASSLKLESVLRPKTEGKSTDVIMNRSISAKYHYRK